jgi:hypothetical protein
MKPAPLSVAEESKAMVATFQVRGRGALLYWSRALVMT